MGAVQYYLMPWRRTEFYPEDEKPLDMPDPNDPDDPRWVSHRRTAWIGTIDIC
jgi:hypothetical protein